MPQKDPVYDIGYHSQRHAHLIGEDEYFWARAEASARLYFSPEERSKRIFEYGCGIGQGIASLPHASGWDVSSEAREICLRRNIAVYDDINMVPRKAWDIVLCRHVLEHLESPLEHLKLMGELIAEDGELLIEREVLGGGKSRAFLGSRPATVALLRELATHLGDIHGQHDQQQLFVPAVQREMLDAFAGEHNLLDEAASLFVRWRAAAADLDFEEAARLRDEIKRLRTTELAVTDDPTAKFLPSPGARTSSRRSGKREGGSKIHTPALDEMGIALHHEVAPHRPGANRTGGPRKPSLDEMGPGVESIPGKQEAGSAEGATRTQRDSRSGPRSTLGRPGMHGGFKPRGR